MRPKIAGVGVGHRRQHDPEPPARAPSASALSQYPLHPMTVGVLLQTSARPAAAIFSRSLLAPKVKRELVEQILGLAIGRQVHAVAEQLGQAVVAQIVGDEQRPRGQRLEDSHVDVVLDAAIENRSSRRIRPGHFLEIALADERVRILAADRLSKSARGPGKTLPTNATSYCLATSCLRWISGSQANGSQADD